MLFKEYYAMPNRWLKFFEKHVHEVWSPSHYGRTALANHRVDARKLAVLPHGVNLAKYRLDVDKYRLSTSKRFKFFANAGIVKRKGLDILLRAFTSTFTRKDDVALVIHSIYNFHETDEFLLKMVKLRNGPEIVYMKETLSEIDMIRLYKSVDVYVTPYRSEGFGLTILEAMAAELPVIVTRYGPSLDFCTDESVFFVDAHEVKCDADPCGDHAVFEFKTKRQPRWSTPSVQSLSDRLLEAYTNPHMLREKARVALAIVQNYTWSRIGDQMADRFVRLAQTLAPSPVSSPPPSKSAKVQKILFNDDTKLD